MMDDDNPYTDGMTDEEVIAATERLYAMSMGSDVERIYDKLNSNALTKRTQS